MRGIKKAVALIDPDDILDEIIARKQLHRQMVGNLYPDILADEIGRLVERFRAVTTENFQDALYARERAQ